MMTVLSRRTVVALSAYIRRLELSVDRSLREDAALLRDYCEKEVHPTPSAVAEWLMSVSGGGDSVASATREVRPSLISGRLQLYMRGRLQLDTAHVGRMAATLQQFSDALRQAAVVEPHVFVPVRLKLTEASEWLLRYVPDARTRRRIARVEHRNQNPVHPTEAFESLAGGPDWLVPHRGKIV